MPSRPRSASQRERLFLIDGSSQMYRAYHGVRGLTAPDGRPTNAVYGFATMLRKLIADHQPTLIAAAFDLRGPTFRTELDADYKANRAPMPDDLRAQAPIVHEACEALGVPILTHERVEADDVIGTLAIQAEAAGFDVAIVTGDKDFYQLVRDGIRIFNPREPGIWYDADGVKAKFGVLPNQVIDVLSLMGDAVDNVKGVPGIGEKGARELITRFGSLDALLDRTDEIEAKRYRRALEQHAGEALHSRELVTIRRDVPVPFDTDALRYRGPSNERCFALFSDLGFRTLMADYAPAPATVETDYGIVRTDADLDGLVAAIAGAGRLGLTVVTDTPQAVSAELVGLSLSAGPGHARYLPLGHRTLEEDTPLDRSKTVAAVAKLLGDPALPVAGHDLKQALMILGRQAMPLDGLDLDTMIASYLLEANRPHHELDQIALELIGRKPAPAEGVVGKGAKAVSFADVPADAAAPWANERCDLMLQLAEQLAAQLQDDGLESLYRDMELPLVPVLADIERAGVLVDTRALATQSAAMETQLADYEQKIHALAGEEFNIASPKQLSAILFDKLQLPSLKRTARPRRHRPR